MGEQVVNIGLAATTPEYRVVSMKRVLKMVECLCPDCQDRARKILAGNFLPDVLNVSPALAQDPTMAEIITRVCEVHGYPVERVLARDNSQSMVSVRMEIIVEARRQNYSLPQIGAALNKHHTTVLHLLRKARKQGLA